MSVPLPTRQGARHAASYRTLLEHVSAFPNHTRNQPLSSPCFSITPRLSCYSASITYFLHISLISTSAHLNRTSLAAPLVAGGAGRPSWGAIFPERTPIRAKATLNLSQCMKLSGGDTASGPLGRLVLMRCCMRCLI